MTRRPPVSKRGYVRAATQGRPMTDKSGRATPDPKRNEEKREHEMGGGTETRTSPYHGPGSEGDPGEP